MQWEQNAIISDTPFLSPLFAGLLWACLYIYTAGCMKAVKLTSMIISSANVVVRMQCYTEMIVISFQK